MAVSSQINHNGMTVLPNTFLMMLGFEFEPTYINMLLPLSIKNIERESSLYGEENIEFYRSRVESINKKAFSSPLGRQLQSGWIDFVALIGREEWIEQVKVGINVAHHLVQR